jgi:xylitol oxidase
MGFTPSAGEELQSEFLFPRAYTVPAIEAVRGLGDRIAPVLQVSEIRTTAADSLWMSPQYGVDTTAIHFTWEPDTDAVLPVLAEVETALAPYDAGPHWGKLFLATADTIAPLYQRLPDFLQLAERLDPRGAFRNEWFERSLLGR